MADEVSASDNKRKLEEDEPPLVAAASSSSSTSSSSKRSRRGEDEEDEEGKVVHTSTKASFVQEAEKDKEEEGAVVEAKSSSSIAIKKREGLVRGSMFGALLGHLGKAKQMLEKDKGVMVKQQQQKQQAMEKARENFLVADSKKREEDKVLEVAREIEKKRRALLEKKHDVTTRLAKWKDRMLIASNCLMTTTHPALCWLPGKACTTTDVMLEQRKKTVETTIALRTEKDEAILAELDEQIMLVEKGGLEGRRSDTQRRRNADAHDEDDSNSDGDGDEDGDGNEDRDGDEDEKSGLGDGSGRSASILSRLGQKSS